MTLNIYECKFMNNANDEIFYVNQYASDEKSIKHFWENYFIDPTKDKYKFISCKIIKENVDVSEDDLNKYWLNKLDIKIEQTKGKSDDK